MNRTRSTITSAGTPAGTWALGAILVAAVLVGTTGSSQAEPERRRSNGLDSQPAVRHRMLLVKHRFELAPLFESTINADFRHILGGGLKLEYHLSDMLSIGVIGVYSGALDTKLTGRLVDSLEGTDPEAREPTREQFTSHLNTMPVHGAAYVSLTPWYGKLAAFSKAFLNFDFYFQAGVAYAQLKSSCSSTVCNDTHPGVDLPDPDGDMGPLTGDRDNNPNDDPPLNDGSRLGLYLGGGVHVFLTEWVALDLTVRDYAFTDNPSGADFNADLAVTDTDDRFQHHLFFGVGASFMLPPSAKRTP